MTKLIHTVRRAGTVNCEVSFPLTKAQMQIVRNHYNRPDGVITFGGRCEIYEQGNGWYAAWSTNDIVDGALRAIANIEAALRVHAQKVLDASVIAVTPVAQTQVIRDNPRVRKYVIQKHYRYQPKANHEHANT